MARDEKVGLGICSIVWRFAKFDRRNPQILLGLRSGELSPGYWAAPGGWLDTKPKKDPKDTKEVIDGEQPRDTAVREAWEECRLTIPPEHLELLNVYCHALRSIDVWCATIYFECKWHKDYGEPQVVEGEKISEWKWFDMNDLPEKIMVSTREAIEDWKKIPTASSVC